jgi:hypothetical protein
MTRLLLLVLSLFTLVAHAATEPPATVDAAPPVPATAPATTPVQGGPGAALSPASPGVSLPDLQVPQPPSVSPTAVQKATG